MYKRVIQSVIANRFFINTTEIEKKKSTLITLNKCVFLRSVSLTNDRKNLLINCAFITSACQH